MEEAAGDDSGLARELARVKEERDHLLAHSRNLETELRRRTLEPARVRELERRLDEAAERLRVQELTLRQAEHLYREVLGSSSWRLTGPYRALRRLLQRQQA